ncbi:MAG: TIGR00282 family metallophosphoesterase [Deltaproteobacteria bacterium]|nr:TIGR00282 family metallophosphoesterase [Deltaproteobacteria bacterium]MBN2670426.1 TIGR00282 family metallophosphoesterase [Deltaproteobacteria bacterium]
MSTLTILMIGDIVAKTGRFAVRKALPGIIGRREVDFVVANGENIAGGIGITPELADDLFDYGVDVITSGNHIWRQREIRPYIEKNNRLLRPHNFTQGQPGRGFGVYETAAGIKVGVINLAGQVYMDINPENPFTAVDQILKQMSGVKVILVDLHAEATSEKRAMGYYLDGRVSAVVGTHTHVQTADEQILPGGTGFLTDVGMTGPHDSIIGMQKELVVGKFVTGMPESFKPAKNGPRFQAVLLEVDTATGKSTHIERIDQTIE